MSEPWEKHLHLCGYEVWHGESGRCYHAGCWEDKAVIKQAQSLPTRQRRSLLREYRCEGSH